MQVCGLLVEGVWRYKRTYELEDYAGTSKEFLLYPWVILRLSCFYYRIFSSHFMSTCS